MEELTITQVARQAGVRPSTLRYYESINLLPPPPRVSGRRRYDPAILDRLSFIQIAQKLGFTLTEIQILFHNQEGISSLSASWQQLARQKLTEVEMLIQRSHQIKTLLLQGLDCTCSDLPDCIDCVLLNCAGTNGKESTR
jgi:MerR family transcriptional regulator, redox-sensitive transcriptional activator SoxR